MNYCVVSGKMFDIEYSTSTTINCTKFTLKNNYFRTDKTSTETTNIRCIAYGALADYINSEMYDGCDVLVTGRVLNRHYITNNTHINKMYIGCNTVTRLEQEEYC